MSKIRRGNFEHYQEAIQSLLRREKCKLATFEEMPEYKEGTFTWWDKVLKKNTNPKCIYTLKKFPSKWTYINIDYQKAGTTLYICSMNYTMAD